MTTITFDTLKYVKVLKAAGFDEVQAEAMAQAQSDFVKQVQESNLKELATKADLKLAISELKAETIKWMFGVAAGQAMFIIAILKLSPTH
ncbi:MAG: DUF1640 domain-containing protein [Magnetococcales bacterium]|nr:DUF1640 domain-containing protein [Magnetococcales bacterium]MBF0321509.1 DUF1640 domain-containing protein [Magnetococcales bacterium]